MRNYDDLYADTREWIQKGYIDYIAPQIYWSIGFKAAAYDVLADWWGKEVNNRQVHLYIGQAAYKINNNADPAWADPGEYGRQIALNRGSVWIKGSMHFSLKDLNRNPLDVKNRLIKDMYSRPALIPEMPWLGHSALKKPAVKRAEKNASGHTLYIEDAKSNGKKTAYYAIYRAEKGKQPYLVDTVRKTSSRTQTFSDTDIRAEEACTYIVTSVDRLHHESRPSAKRTIK